MDKFLYDEIVHIWQFEEQQYALNDWNYNLGPWGGHLLLVVTHYYRLQVWTLTLSPFVLIKGITNILQ
jgi:hypothetical protein